MSEHPLFHIIEVEDQEVEVHIGISPDQVEFVTINDHTYPIIPGIAGDGNEFVPGKGSAQSQAELDLAWSLVVCPTAHQELLEHDPELAQRLQHVFCC